MPHARLCGPWALHISVAPAGSVHTFILAGGPQAIAGVMPHVRPLAASCIGAPTHNIYSGTMDAGEHGGSTPLPRLAARAGLADLSGSLAITPGRAL